MLRFLTAGESHGSALAVILEGMPAGLTLDSDEAAGEVQTPLVGAAAKKLRVGDRVYMRHAKAGEFCERFDSLYLIEGDSVVDEVPTYRGERLTFL